jgi:hypothetical protein
MNMTLKGKFHYHSRRRYGAKPLEIICARSASRNVFEKSIRKRKEYRLQKYSIYGDLNQNYFPYSRQLHLDVTKKYIKHDVPLNNAEYRHELYNHQMKPILVVMRIFGIFPVEMLSGT